MQISFYKVGYCNVLHSTYNQGEKLCYFACRWQFSTGLYPNKQISSKCVSIYFLFLMLFNSYNRNLDVKLKNQCSYIFLINRAPAMVNLDLYKLTYFHVSPLDYYVNEKLP